MIIEIISYFDIGYQIVGVEKVVCQTSGQVQLIITEWSDDHGFEDGIIADWILIIIHSFKLFQLSVEWRTANVQAQ